MTLIQFVRANGPFLLAGTLLTFTSSFGQTFFISIFAGEIMAEFGLSHGAWGLIYAAGTTASAATMIWAGALTDRYRVRQLGAIVLGALALSCLTMAALPSVWLLPLVIFGLRVFGQGMVSHTAMVAMARWYVATRGRAISIASTGFALGEAVLPLTFVALLTVAPWRLLWVLAALIALAILPFVVRLLAQERTPQAVAAETEATGMHARHWRRAEVLRHRLFWLTVPALIGPPAFGTAFFFQQVHLAEAKGWPHVQLVALFPVYTVVSIAATLTSGWIIDRVGTGRLMPVFLLPMAAGFVFLGVAQSLTGAAAALVLMALTHGAAFALLAAFWAEFYGTRHVGAIRAVATAASVFGTAVGPALTGALIDSGVSFPEQMPGIAAYFILASAAAWLGVSQARPHLSPSQPHVVRPGAAVAAVRRAHLLHDLRQRRRLQPVRDLMAQYALPLAHLGGAGIAPTLSSDDEDEA